MGHRYGWGHATIPQFEEVVQPVVENLQPIRAGRTIAAGVLKGESDTVREDRLAREYAEWTQRLTASALASSDDPLAVWLAYVRWTDTEYPCDVRRSQKALHKCLARFEESPRYRNDARYVELWLRWVSQSSDGHRCYKLLMDKQIGAECAAFYIQYAAYLELKGLYREVDAVFAKGVSMNAAPLTELKYHLAVWQKRLAAKNKRLAERTAELQAQQCPGAWESADREEFGDLLTDSRDSARAALGLIQSRRAAATLQQPRTALAAMPASPHDAEQFEIWSDSRTALVEPENRAASAVAPAPSVLEVDGGGGGGVVGRDGRENTLPPSAWSGIKLRQRRPSHSLLRRGDSSAAVEIPVFEDRSQQTVIRQVRNNTVNLVPVSLEEIARDTLPVLPALPTTGAPVVRQVEPNSTAATTTDSSPAAQQQSPSAAQPSTSKARPPSDATLVAGLAERLVNSAGEEQCIEEHRGNWRRT